TSSGLVSTVALVLQPSAITVDHNGNVFVSGAKTISKITPSGSLSTVLDGLSSPRGLALTEAGDLIVADAGANVVRRLSSTGTLSTIAGTGAAGFSGDGQPASAGQLNSPTDLVVDATGTIGIADSG